MRSNYDKAKIDTTQENSKCRLCDDRDETINHIISECIKLAQKEYKTRHDWEDKVIHWELCKKLKFDHPNKWYMRNPESILKNEMPKLLYYFDIQTDHLFTARRPDLVIVSKKEKKKKRENLPNGGLCRPGGPQSENKRKRKER